mmetsp:Transcript_153/g.318  ORF Transcript_153/g.318 Transcript_153/m.318 type:complete len:258 (-) Transcript_153:1690-2463(-)
MPISPASSTPFLTISDSCSRCMLHGFPSYHTLEMPTCALFKSALVSPVACNIACEAPWLLGWVIVLLYSLSFSSEENVRAVNEVRHLEDFVSREGRRESIVSGSHSVQLVHEQIFAFFFFFFFFPGTSVAHQHPRKSKRYHYETPQRFCQQHLARQSLRAAGTRTDLCFFLFFQLYTSPQRKSKRHHKHRSPIQTNLFAECSPQGPGRRVNSNALAFQALASAQVSSNSRLFSKHATADPKLFKWYSQIPLLYQLTG